MIKKVLGRSIGGTAVAGLVLTAAPVAISPQIVPMACPYPPANASQTDLTLARAVAAWGSITTATATVTSGAGTPAGQVQFLVNGTVRATVSLSAGKATWTLPRTLRARKTHVVQARFSDACDWADSAQSKFYTVVKAKAAVKAKVVKAKKAKFKGKVSSVTGLKAKTGKVVFKVKKGKKTVRSGIRKVKNGVATVNFKDLKKGRYVLKVRYLGNKNIRPGIKSKKFRVR